MFTDTDEPLTFVAHGDHEVLRVYRNSNVVGKEPSWVFELFTPLGKAVILVKDEAARDLAAMLNVPGSKP